MSPRDQSNMRKSAQLFDLNYHMNELSGGSNNRRSNNVYVKNRKTGVGELDQNSLQEEFANAAEEQDRFRHLTTTKQRSGRVVTDKARNLNDDGFEEPDFGDLAQRPDMNALHEEIASSVAQSQDEVSLSHQRFAPQAVNLGITREKSGEKRGSIMEDSVAPGSCRPSIRTELKHQLAAENLLS